MGCAGLPEGLSDPIHSVRRIASERLEPESCGDSRVGNELRVIVYTPLKVKSLTKRASPLIEWRKIFTDCMEKRERVLPGCRSGATRASGVRL
jgi:hypothetical protein